MISRTMVLGAAASQGRGAHDIHDDLGAWITGQNGCAAGQDRCASRRCRSKYWKAARDYDDSSRRGRTNRKGPGPGFRCHRNRSGNVGDVPAIPFAGTRPAGACPGGGNQGRGDLVLEPLSGRPFRFRELFLWLFLFAGTVRRMGLERALLRSTGNRALLQPCRR